MNDKRTNKQTNEHTTQHNSLFGGRRRRHCEKGELRAELFFIFVLVIVVGYCLLIFSTLKGNKVHI